MGLFRRTTRHWYCVNWVADGDLEEFRRAVKAAREARIVPAEEPMLVRPGRSPGERTLLFTRVIYDALRFKADVMKAKQCPPPTGVEKGLWE